MSKSEDILFLFDVDGTLTPSREKATPEIIAMLEELKTKVTVGFVGGSDLGKQMEQIGTNLLDLFDYGFPENGVQYYKGKELVSADSFIKFIGEENYKKLVNRIMVLFSKVDCPVKRGNFIELRDSMLNICPVGRTCSKKEREDFFNYDKKQKIRKMIADTINEEFKDLNIQCSIGGQISIDIFPKGWDKTYCLNHIKQQKIYFFGDMTSEGGNDYEIFNHKRVIGTTVTSPEDTIKKVGERLKELGIK